MPNYIRTKQIDQGDLSGVVQNVIDSNQFNFNVGLTGTGVNISNVSYINLSGVSINLIDSLVSGIQINNVVYSTGDQTISGTKTFANPIYFTSGINGGAGGLIDLRGGDADQYSAGGVGGSITMRGALQINDNGKAGDINTSASDDAKGGHIYTFGGGEGAPGGTIATYGGSYNMPGGNINTSNGGGFISTQGKGGYIKTDGYNNESAGGYIDTSATNDGPGGSINLSAENAQGGSIDLSSNGGANLIIKDLNLSTVQYYSADGTVYNKINDALYILKNGYWEKVITNVDNLVYATGNQTISGVKTFANNLQVSGTGIFNALDLNNIDNLSFSGVDVTITSGIVALTNPVSAPNLVYNTGNQSISGNKTFLGNIVINNLTITGTQSIVNTSNINIGSNFLLLNVTGGSGVIHGPASDGGIFFVTGEGKTGIYDTGAILGFDFPSNKWVFGTASRNDDIQYLNQIASVSLVTGLSGAAILLNGNQTINGTKTFSSAIDGSINGNAATVTDGVYTTGNQTIGGTKTFSSTPVFNGGADLANQTIIKATPGIISTGTAPTLTDANYNGRVIYMTNSSSQTITIPAGLSVGFNCTIIQGGAGTVLVAAGGSVTLNGYGGLKTLAGQYAAVSILSISSNNYIIYGNTI
jgi:hypothetical protein